MRKLWLLALAIDAIVACSTGPRSMSDGIAGNWSSWAPHQGATPGGPMIFRLSESGDAVSGVSTWSASRWSVSGTYTRPTITLELTLTGNHQVTSWVGQAIDADKIELNGTTFYRQ